MRYEVKVWVMPPVLAEVTGRFDSVEESLTHIKSILKKQKYTLDDIELYDNWEHKKLDVGIREVSVYGKRKVFNNL